MPNLIEELGADYVTDMYHGALFLHEGVPHMFQRAGNRVCVAHMAVQQDQWKMVEIPAAAFEDMGKFQWPQLGYRNVQYKKHNLVVDVAMLRSAKRGLRTALLTAEGTKAGSLFNTADPWVHLIGPGNVAQANTLLLPKWYTLAAAREALASGTAVSCALSSNLALEINPFVEDPKELSVLFRGAKVGAMLGDGTLEVPSRLAMRIAG